MPSLAESDHLQGDGAGGHRDHHQEADAGRGVAVEAGEPPAVIVIPDRDVPGIEGERLGGADDDGVAGVHSLDLPIARHPVGEAEEQPAEDQRDGDDRRRAEVLVDRVLEHRADRRRRHRRQEQQPGDAAVGVAPSAGRSGARPGA